MGLAVCCLILSCFFQAPNTSFETVIWQDDDIIIREIPLVSEPVDSGQSTTSVSQIPSRPNYGFETSRFTGGRYASVTTSYTRSTLKARTTSICRETWSMGTSRRITLLGECFPGSTGAESYGASSTGTPLASPCQSISMRPGNVYRRGCPFIVMTVEHLILF